MEKKKGRKIHCILTRPNTTAQTARLLNGAARSPRAGLYRPRGCWLLFCHIYSPSGGRLKSANFGLARLAAAISLGYRQNITKRKMNIGRHMALMTSQRESNSGELLCANNVTADITRGGHTPRPSKRDSAELFVSFPPQEAEEKIKLKSPLHCMLGAK